MKNKVIVIISLFFLSFICVFANFISSKEDVKELEVYDVLTEDVSIDESGAKIEKHINKAPEANNKISKVLAQVSPETDGKRSVRVLAGIDSYLYNDAKFDILVKDGDNIHKTFENKIISRAYTHVVASGITYSASEAFGAEFNYLVAFTINNVPEYAWNFTFEVVVSIRKTSTDIYTSSEVSHKVIQDMVDADEQLEAQKVELNVTSNNAVAGNIVGAGKYLPNANVNLTVEENEGFVFVGWYKDNELVSSEKALSFKMPGEDLKYQVKFAKKINLSEYEFEGIIYSLSENQLSVTRYTDDMASDVVLLSTLDGYNVTKISINAFKQCSKLRSIIIPNSVTTIKQQVFMHANNLKSVNILGEITSIDAYTFLGCSNLESIVIPESVTNIGTSAFRDCSSLTTIEIPGSVKTISDYAFHSCSGLKSIVIHEGIENIGSDILSGCNNLESITLPFVGEKADGSGVTNFGYLFGARGYQGQSYYIPSSIKEVTITGDGDIPEGAFYTCRDLTIIKLVGNVKSIGKYAFSYCESLLSFEIPNSVTNIENQSFNECKSLTSIKIPDGVTTIKENTFHGCSSLVSIHIGKGVTTIEHQSFYGCTSLKDIVIENNIPVVKGDPFYNSSLKNLYYNGTMEDWCNLKIDGNIISKSLLNYSANRYMLDENNEWYEVTSIVIPDSITSIGDYQFYMFENVTSIIIPESVTLIGESAFSKCTNLSSITIPFVGMSKDANDTNSQFKYIFGSLPKNLKEVTVLSGEIKDYAFSGCSSLTNIVILENVTGIGDYAFSGCSSLTNIVIPENVTGIGDYAFSGCSSLTNIVIPESVTSIGERAFYKCSSLANIVMKKGISWCGLFAFYNCSSLENVYFEGTIEDWCNITFYSSHSSPMYYASHFYMLNENNEWDEVTSIEIPNNITSIGYDQFFGFKNVTSIIIPDSVTSIGSDAFSNCNSLIYNEINGGKYLGNENNRYLYLASVDNDVTSFTIKEETRFIGTHAFYLCDKLINLEFFNNVTNICSYAFSICDNLENVYYEGTIDNWCEISFDGMHSNPMYYAIHIYMLDENNEWYEPTSIEIPNNITSIGSYQFSGFKNVTSIIIPENVTSIGSGAFHGCASLTNITIPSNITSFEFETFSGCSSLTSIIIPESVTSIGYYAFFDCDSLENVYYEGTIDNWCEISFDDMRSNPMYYAIHIYMLDENNEWYEPTSIEIPNNITSIGSYQFSGFKNISSIVMHENVVSIGKSTFYNCASLENVYYEGTIDNWCKISFDNVSSNPMYYASHFYMLNENNEWYELTSIEIPNNITSIGSYQFSGFKNVTSIIIPENVTSIGSGAFRNCSSLESITIPDSVKTIGTYVFSGCSSLTSIVIPESVTSIGYYAFFDCDSLENVYYNGTMDDWGKISFDGMHSNPMYYASHFYVLDENNEWIEKIIE